MPKLFLYKQSYTFKQSKKVLFIFKLYITLYQSKNLEKKLKGIIIQTWIFI